MRKVFLSNIILSELKETKYVSDDFSLGNNNYIFMLSYLIDMYVNKGDEVVVIICHTEEKTALANFEQLKKEVAGILEEKYARYTFTDIVQDVDFDASSFNTFFKKIAKELKDKDRLYLDVTFGLKPYSISMFIALTYAVKSAQDVKLEVMTYAQKYRGESDSEKTNVSKIYDITSLFYLNEMAANLHVGDKEHADKMLDILIPDKL